MSYYGMEDYPQSAVETAERLWKLEKDLAGINPAAVKPMYEALKDVAKQIKSSPAMGEDAIDDSNVLAALALAERKQATDEMGE